MLGLSRQTRACLFDLDGVLTQTARVHAAAWKEMFDEFLRRRAGERDESYVPFDAVEGYEQYVDGRPRFEGVASFLAEREHLRDKPAPDTYLAAARELGVEPGAAAVFEDALAGVEAGRAGRFGTVVGVDRLGQADALRTHGADVVVGDLAELLRER